MSNAPSVDVKSWLSTAGVGTFGTDLFIGKEPSSPDNCVSVKDTGGFPPERHANYRPTVQVLVRNNGYLDGYAKAAAVYTALHEKTNTSVSTTRYLHVLAMGEIIYVGQDEAGRCLFSLNFEIRRTA
jgi:hypothetical protein